jgi:hypothetical protein
MPERFPYWKYSLDHPIVMLSHLKNQELNVEKDKDGNSILIREYPKDYIYCDHISNHFTEYVRIHCRFANNPTPYEVFIMVKDNTDFKKLSKLDKREYIYSKTRECNTFNDTYALYIISKLVGSHPKILDPSMGWGDRLIASIANGIELYDGFDPNKQLLAGYRKIKKIFAKDLNINIKPIPFENADVKKNYYDLVLTSPPYYNIEQYGDDPEQSIIKYKTFPEWLKNFYEPYMSKMVYATKPGGFIAMYIEDIYSNNTKYSLRLYAINFMEKQSVKFYSKIGLKTGVKTRYTLIWKKQ